jgi:hypothetical protein
MKERKFRPSYPLASVPARLPIHFYCREPLARAFLEVAPADLARTDWYPATQPEKADKVRAEDVAGLAGEDPVADKASRGALADRAAEALQVAESLAGLLAAEGQAAVAAGECLAGAAD